MFRYNKSTREDVIRNLQALILRLFMQVPCGKIRFTMIDPIDLGSNFAMFVNKFGEIDEKLVDTRIWTEEDRIEERMKMLQEEATDIIQRCLGGIDRNIVEYNKRAGRNAEPLHVLVVTDFPHNFNERSLNMLRSIISNGPKCGIYVMLSGDEETFRENVWFIRIWMQFVAVSTPFTARVMNFRRNWKTARNAASIFRIVCRMRGR